MPKCNFCIQAIFCLSTLQHPYPCTVGYEILVTSLESLKFFNVPNVSLQRFCTAIVRKSLVTHNNVVAFPGFLNCEIFITNIVLTANEYWLHK